jgi:hypothetical protein
MLRNARSLVALAVLLALAGPAVAEDLPASTGPAAPPDASPPALPEEPAPVVSDPLPVPPGSKADQQLWMDAGEVGNQLIALRHFGHGLHWKIRNEDLQARLMTMATADPAAVARLGVIRKELSEAQAASYADLVSRWPVDKTRVCQYAQLSMRSAMEASVIQDKRAELEQTRVATARCLDLARATLTRVKRSTDALAAAIAIAEQALAAPVSTGR